MADAPRVHIFSGPDGFSAREAVRELRTRLGVADSNVVRLDDRASIGDIATAAHTATFFAEPRLVIIDGMAERLSGRRRSGGRAPRARKTGAPPAASELDQLAEIMATVPESTTVVMLDAEPGAGFLDAFKGLARVTTFAIKRGGEVRHWADARVKSQGGSISGAALDRLSHMLDGFHIGELAQEIDKLIAYTDGRRIEVADVEAVCSGAVSLQTWDLTDAVVAGQARQALGILQRMDEKSQPPQLLLSMIVRQFRQIMVAQAMLREGFAAPQVGERLGISHHYPLGKVIDQASRYPAERLEQAFRRLLETDAAVKTGLMDIETAIEVLIVDLAEIANAGRRSQGSGNAAAGMRRRF